MKNIILLVGGPGCGKSTQAKMLAQSHSEFIHVSAGDLVREIIKDSSNPLAKECQERMQKGELLPDSLIKKIIAAKFASLDDHKTLLLDGYPRTLAQLEDFQHEFGQAKAIIHLDVSEDEMKNRLMNREDNRIDDKPEVIAKRIDLFKRDTLPTIEALKKIGPYFLLNSSQPKEEVQQNFSKVVKSVKEKITDVSLFQFAKLYWQKGNIYDVCEALEKDSNNDNFSLQLGGNRFATILQTHDAVKCVLNAKSKFGNVYHQFSKAANLKYDFVATDMHNGKLIDENGEVNFWYLAHHGFKHATKDDKELIGKLIDKHFHEFIGQKTFDLDINFDNFFNAFWCDYMFGDAVQPDEYTKVRDQILNIMKYSFYQNRFKGLDCYNISSPFWSIFKRNELAAAKNAIKVFIQKSKTGLVARFKEYLLKCNLEHQLNLSNEVLDEIVEDNVFDFFFEPDFLAGVIYETLVEMITNKIDAKNKPELDKAYQQGLKRAFLFPFRTRILEESVILPDGTALPARSLIFINLKKSGWYHSTGVRACPGQTFAANFKNHFFDKLKNVEFKIKEISHPKERKRQDKDVPVSPERYSVSWRFKRDSLQATLPYQIYNNKRFYDVLTVNEDVAETKLITDQFVHKIKKMMSDNHLSKEEMVIVAPEMRGVPIASMVADRLELPLFIIRKEGGYKMPETELCKQSYEKGYQKSDTIEFPLNKKESLKGKTAILIDDGIASGGSALACCKLLETLEVPVKLVLAMIKHKYVETSKALYTPLRKVKTLFDFEDLPPTKMTPSDPLSANLRNR